MKQNDSKGLRLVSGQYLFYAAIGTTSTLGRCRWKSGSRANDLMGMNQNASADQVARIQILYFVGAQTYLPVLSMYPHFLPTSTFASPSEKIWPSSYCGAMTI
jgi:hypothetical protein